MFVSLANAFPQTFDLQAMSESQRALELRKARDVNFCRAEGDNAD